MRRVLQFILGAAVLAAPALAQNSPLPLPAPVEKELAAHASNVTEVTLGKNMLAFAAKFMNGDNKNDVATRRLIEGLDGIYVRDYEFEKPGEYSMVDINKLRQYFQTPEWTPIVHERDVKSGESTDVMMKMINGESRGMFVLSAEPKELSIVMILGPIRMDELNQLKGLGGLGGLGQIGNSSSANEKSKDKVREKLSLKGGSGK